MTSVADKHPDADDGFEEISPELVLVDPDLAQRLRERESAPAVDDMQPARALRLVSAAEPKAVEPVVPMSLRHGIEERVPETVEDLAEDTATVEPDVPSDGADELVVPEAPSAFEPSQVPPEAPSPPPPAAVVDVRNRLVPGLAVDLVEPVRPVPIPTSEDVDIFVPKPAPVVSNPVVVVPEPRIEAPEPALPPEPTIDLSEPPIAVAEPAPDPPAVTTLDPLKERLPPAPPRRRRGRRLLAFVLGTAIASAVTLGVLTVMDRSPVPSGVVSSWPVVGDDQQDAAQPTKTPKTRTTAASDPKPSSPSPPPSSTAKPKAATKPKPKSKPKSASKPRVTTPVTPSPRRFAWAPVAGAVSYHVEIFRGADRILSRNTTQPVLELGRTWRYEGRGMGLTDGSYRWYVWVVTKSGRNQRAIVQAKLSVP